jgi:hypothetical protein
MRYGPGGVVHDSSRSCQPPAMTWPGNRMCPSMCAGQLLSPAAHTMANALNRNHLLQASSCPKVARHDNMVCLLIRYGLSTAVVAQACNQLLQSLSCPGRCRKARHRRAFADEALGLPNYSYRRAGLRNPPPHSCCRKASTTAANGARAT